MPIYEYECKKCGHRLEILIRGNDIPVCPKCNGTELSRLFSTFNASGSKQTQSHHTSGGGCSCCPSSKFCPSVK